jgi:hypothetical protein
MRRNAAFRQAASAIYGREYQHVLIVVPLTSRSGAQVLAHAEE